MGDTTPFVIVTLARSGSTHLVSLLNQHPDITCYGEPLAEGANGGWCATDDELVAAFTGTTTTTGYKILGEQLDNRPDTLTRLQQVPDIRWIVLERRNQIDRIRSIVQADQTGVWAWGTTAPPPQPPRIHLDLQFCRDRLTQADQFYRNCDTLRPHVWLYYEDLCDDQDATLSPVWQLLGVPDPGPVQSGNARLEHRSLADTITNWPQICEELSWM